MEIKIQTPLLFRNAKIKRLLIDEMLKNSQKLTISLTWVNAKNILTTDKNILVNQVYCWVLTKDYKLNFTRGNQDLYNEFTKQKGYKKSKDNTKESNNFYDWATANKKLTKDYADSGKWGHEYYNTAPLDFETEAEREKYFLRNPLTYNLTMNRNLIEASFDATTPQLAMYDANGNIICDDTDIIGYCITNKGYNPNFDSKQFENDEAILYSFVKQIEGSHPSLANVDAALGNGLLDREWGEYRSYYQKPYVYFNKIVQQVIEQMKTLTDYTIELDSDIFK